MVDRNLIAFFRGGKFGTREGMLIDLPPSGFDWRAVNRALPAVIDPFLESSFQEFPLGTKLTYGEQVFRYARCKSDTAIEVSALCQAVVPLAGHIAETGTVAQAVGDTQITFTPNTVSTDDLAANELQDGEAFFYDGTGEGYQHRILSHPAILGGSAGVLTLVDPIRLVNGATTAITVTHNQFYGVIIHPAIPTAKPVGWTVNAVTAGAYFWILTKGPTGALIDSGGVAVVMGHPCVPSTEDDGAVQEFNADTATEPDSGPVGWIQQIGSDAAGAAATFGQVYAQLE